MNKESETHIPGPGTSSSASDLKLDLKHAGFREDDTVLVHSSMKSIGAVEGGADTVLDVLMDYFGRKGLLVLPALSYADVNAEQRVFSPENTPACIGLLPEMFRRRPGVKRSLHPTHSVAAFGPDAESFVSGHERFDTPCARQSPWGRLADRHAKIFFIGTGTMCCNTFLHGVEEWAGVPGSLTESRQPLEIHLADGTVVPVPSLRHQGAHSNYYGKMEPLFFRQGLVRRAAFGAADCRILDAFGTMNYVLGLLAREPLLFTHDRLPR